MIIKQLPDDKTLEFKARIFKVIGDPNRVKILEILRNGEICQCEIIPLIGQSQPAVSRHLKLLEESGLITSYKNTTKIFYNISDKHIYTLLDSIDKKMKKIISEEIIKKYQI